MLFPPLEHECHECRNFVCLFANTPQAQGCDWNPVNSQQTFADWMYEWKSQWTIHWNVLGSQRQAREEEKEMKRQRGERNECFLFRGILAND